MTVTSTISREPTRYLSRKGILDPAVLLLQAGTMHTWRLICDLSVSQSHLATSNNFKEGREYT